MIVSLELALILFEIHLACALWRYDIAILCFCKPHWLNYHPSVECFYPSLAPWALTFQLWTLHLALGLNTFPFPKLRLVEEHFNFWWIAFGCYWWMNLVIWWDVSLSQFGNWVVLFFFYMLFIHFLSERKMKKRKKFQWPKNGEKVQKESTKKITKELLSLIHIWRCRRRG